MKKQNNASNTDERENIVINIIENFVETKNRYIQVILLIIATVAGGIYGFVPENMQTAIRYTLVINMFLEIYVLQTKDSILQRKMNDLTVDFVAQYGGIRFEKDISIDDFFKNAKTDIFISGISPSRFIQRYQTAIETAINENSNMRIYILISSLDAVAENCAEYYGLKDNKNHQYDLLSKLNIVINTIQNSSTMKRAFIDGYLLLAVSDIVFTTTYIAYNLFEAPKFHSKIKVTFYQQGEYRVGYLPCVIVDSDKNGRDMYPYFQNNIINQWKASRLIKDEKELNEYSNKLLERLTQCK